MDSATNMNCFTKNKTMLGCLHFTSFSEIDFTFSDSDLWKMSWTPCSNVDPREKLKMELAAFGSQCSMSKLPQEQCQIIDAQLRGKKLNNCTSWYDELPIKVASGIQTKQKLYLARVWNGTNVISHGTCICIYLQEQELLQNLSECEIIKFDIEVLMNIINVVRGNETCIQTLWILNW